MTTIGHFCVQNGYPAIICLTMPILDDQKSLPITFSPFQTHKLLLFFKKAIEVGNLSYLSVLYDDSSVRNVHKHIYNIIYFQFLIQYNNIYITR